MSRKFSVVNGLEALEARLCPTTFQYDSISQYLKISPVIAELSPPAGSDAINFGVSVAGLGDIDDDGVPDFGVGADGVAPGGGISATGKVFLFSGRTRGLIRTLEDGSIGFGRALANLGDVNGDDVPDLAVGSPTRAIATSVFGAVVAYSGADGSMLWEVVGDGPDGLLGRALAPLRDLDIDGARELAAGGRVGLQGEVRVLSGASGGLLLTLSEGSTNASFGSSVVALNPINSTFAVAVGAPDEGNGAVYLYDSVGAQITRIGSSYAGARLGAALATFASNGASNAVLAMGAPDAQLPNDEVYFGATGYVKLYLFGPVTSYFGLDPQSLHGRAPGEHFGAFLSDIGDQDGDGLSDLGVGVPGTSGPGSTLTYVGGNPLHSGPFKVTKSGFSWPKAGALASAGDIGADGFQDVLMGTAGAGLYSGAFAALGPAAQTDGGSANVRWLWRSPTSFQPGFFVKDGKVLSAAALAGLFTDDVIFGMSDSGTIAVVWRTSGNKQVFTYIRAGQRLTIDRAITNTVAGGVDTSALAPSKVGPGGHILFNVAHPTIREASVAWVLDPDGTLRFLWNGAAADVNPSGIVVGTRYLPGNGNEAVEYSGGSVSVVRGLVGAQAINSAGDVAGWAGTDEIVVVKSGIPTVIGHVNALLAGSPIATWAAVTSLDDAGRLIGLVDYPGQSRHLLYYSAGTGLLLADLLTVGAPGPLNLAAGQGPIAIDTSGTIVGSRYTLTLVDDRVGFSARDLGTQVLVVGSSGTQLVATNIFGEPVVFTRDTAGAWHGRDARTGYRVAASEQNFVSWVDAVDGLTYVVFVTDHWGSAPLQTVMLRDAAGALGAPAIWSMIVTGTAQSVFAADLVSFISIDGLVHIVGRDALNHLVMMSRNNADMAGANAWTYTNISRDHLQFQGMTTPAWVGTPVAYVTAWNSFNIAGLNSSGEVENVWYVPGMPLWRTDNLSTIASAPALSGGITAFTTPWGGINVVGATASGDLTTLWWAPALGGQWLTSNLSDAAGSSIKLRADTLTSYVTPWGGLNIAGIDENGGVTVFWWTATTNAWIASTVTPDVSISPPPSGPLSSGVTTSGQVHIGGVSTLGDVIDLSWEPGGSWGLADVTQTAM